MAIECVTTNGLMSLWWQCHRVLCRWPFIGSKGVSAPKARLEAPTHELCPGMVQGFARSVARADHAAAAYHRHHASQGTKEPGHQGTTRQKHSDATRLLVC